MRTARYHALWAALQLGAAHSGAQTPLWADPTFVAPFDFSSADPGGPGYPVRLDDGNILVSGTFQYPGDPNVHHCAVLGNNGELVSPNFYGTYMGLGRMVEWNDMIYNQHPGLIDRYFHDGTIDPTFDMGQSYVDFLQPAEFNVEGDGSVLCAGAIRIAPGIGQPIYGLVKFTNTGAVDSTYQHRLSNGNIHVLRGTGDGRYWCSGVLDNYDGHPVSRFFRIWPDGELDPTFSTPIVAGYARGVYTMPNGKLILAGGFVVSGVTDTLYVIRLNPDGSLDSNFNNSLHLEWFNDSLMALVPGVADMIPLDSAHLMIGGSFWTIDGERRGAIAVIDTAGNLDTVLCNYYGCDSVSGGPDNDRAYGAVGDLAMLDDGFVYVCGAYTGFDDGIWHPEQGMITRLYPLSVGLPEQVARPVSLSLSPNPGSTYVNINTDHSGQGDIAVYDMWGRTVLMDRVDGVERRLGTSSLPTGTYIVELRAKDQPSQRLMWVKE